MILAWHFLRAPSTYANSLPWSPEVKHIGPLVLCKSGLHASERAIDSLRYAPGPIVCRVECSGKIIHGDDKLVCRERRVLWQADATDVLRLFARQCALDVAHRWAMPATVRAYLETGDESKRIAAESAAQSAAWSAAQSAACAAQSAACATWSAAQSAAQSTAQSAAWSAARSAAQSAARSAAWSAAWSAAQSTAWSTARSAAQSAQNTRLTAMLEELKP